MPRSEPEESLVILVAAFLSGLVIYLIGSLLERREDADRERKRRERSRRG
jgi:hypothetical protein